MENPSESVDSVHEDTSVLLESKKIRTQDSSISDEQLLAGTVKWINTSGPFTHAEDEYGGGL